MKNIIISIIFTGAIGLGASSAFSANNTISIVAANGQVLEMPVYQEQEIQEVIPGTSNNCCNYHFDLRKPADLISPETLSRILLCISKPEMEEPFPFETN